MSDPFTTEARRTANRQNAQQSTGPRTAAGKARSSQNAFRHGAYSQPRLRVLEEFGEESEDYRELLAGTLESCPPANPLERELIEDIARLRWERRRLGRAKDAKARTRLDALQLEWQRRKVQMEYEYSTAPPEQTLAFGLRRLPDSLGKYRDLLALLDVLETQIAAGDFSAETGKLFQGLWGVQPTLRGVEILANFHRLAQQGGLKHIHPDGACGANGESARESPAKGVLPPVSAPATARCSDPVPTGAAGDEDITAAARPCRGGFRNPPLGTGETARKNAAVTPDWIGGRRYSEGEMPGKNTAVIDRRYRAGEAPVVQEEEQARREEALAYRSLRLALMEERRDVLVERELFEKQRVPASRAAIDACLAPTDDGEWRLLMRWENSIDRQIERKIKLYLLLQGKATVIHAKLAPGADGGGNGRGGGSKSDQGTPRRVPAGGPGRQMATQKTMSPRPQSSGDFISPRLPARRAKAGDVKSPLQQGQDDGGHPRGGGDPPLQPVAAIDSFNLRPSTLDCSSKRSVFGNEAKNLLKTQGDSRNEAKRSQVMPRPRVHPPETKELSALNPRLLTVNCRLLTALQPFALPAASG